MTAVDGVDLDTRPGPLGRHVPYGVVVTDADWTVLYANAAVHELLPDLEQLVGRRFPELLAPASRIYHETHYAPLVQLQGRIREVSADLRTPDGDRPVLLGSNALREADGSIATIVTALVVVEDRHSYEQELLAARRRAEASEARERQLQQVLTDLATALTTADVAGVLDGFVTDLLGPCTTSLRFDAPADDEWLDEQDREAARARRAALESGAPSAAGPDGVTAVPVPTGTGPSGMLVVRPQDGQRPSGAQLDLLHSVGRQAGQVLERARLHEAKDLMLGMVAHDLRTPLATIGGFAETLQRVLDDAGPTVGDMLERIVSATGRLTRLTDDLLDASVLQLSGLQLEREVRAVAPIVTPLVRGYGLLAGEKDITLRVVDRSDGAEAPVDADRLAQVVDNLVSNALKYTPRGGTVEVELDATPDAVRVAVSDDGPGIPAHEVKLALAPFGVTSNRPTGAESSTGLGLAIAHHLVEEHGGELTVGSNDAGGSTFSFTLPTGPTADPA